MKEIIITSFTEWDTRLFYRIFKLNGSTLLNSFMIALTKSADGPLLPLVPLWFLFSNLEVGVNILLAGVIGYVIELILHHYLKGGIKRDRPFNAIPDIEYILAPPDQFSFPSGHTAAAFVMATLVATYYPPAALTMFSWATYGWNFACVFGTSLSNRCTGRRCSWCCKCKNWHCTDPIFLI